MFWDKKKNEVASFLLYAHIHIYLTNVILKCLLIQSFIKEMSVECVLHTRHCNSKLNKAPLLGSLLSGGWELHKIS